MPLDQAPGEDDIIARLKTIQGVDVIDGEYTDDSYIPAVDANKLFKPYITLGFFPASDALDNGIADPSWDTQRATVEVFIVSPDAGLTRRLRDQVKRKLEIGFRPTDSGYLKPRGGYKFVDPDVGYHRYVQVLSYRYHFNLSPTEGS